MSTSSTIVVPWLVDLEFSDLSGPLAQFQALRSDAQSFQRLADLVCQKASTPLPSNVEQWASAIEAEIRRLVGSGQKENEAKPREDWLALIEEAKRARNLDQLDSLRRAAESELPSDLAVARALMEAYFDLKEFTGLLETFERFRSTMAHDAKSLSLYGTALLRTGQTSTAIGILEEAQKLDPVDAEVTGLLARALKDQWRKRRSEGNLTAAHESLQRAATTYAEGFRREPALYYQGLNAVELLHILGDEQSLTLRDELLPLVQTSLERAAEKSSDYWTTASLLELAVVRGSQAEAEDLARQVLENSTARWEIETTAQQLRLLSDAKGEAGNQPEWVRSLVASLER
jgi:tetratricopeptide (TPR) repeat protein